jgi:hypothetical protein
MLPLQLLWNVCELLRQLDGLQTRMFKHEKGMPQGHLMTVSYDTGHFIQFRPNCDSLK